MHHFSCKFSFRVAAFVGLAAALLVTARPGSASSSDPNLTESSYATIPTGSPYSGITGIAWAPDGTNRLFIIQQYGQVRIVKDGALLSTPFATLSVRGPTGGACSECGLLGIAFDPNFASNQRIFVFATIS